MQPPCGPTFVSIPIDDWDETTEPQVARRVSRSFRPDAAAIGAVAAALNASQRPVFIIGGAVDRDGAWDDIVQLAERHGAIVWSSPLIGRAGFPEDHPLFAGFLPAFREEICGRLKGHDVLVALGAPLFTYHAEGHGRYVPEGLVVYQITEDPDWAASALAGQSILGSVGTAIRDLLSVPRTAKAAPQQGRVTPSRLLPADPLTDSYLAQVLADLRAPDSILVEEAPSTRGPMQTYLPILQSETFYTCASGGLGHGLPAAVGVALGKPGKKVIAILGDGSAMYSIQGLWSAAQLKLPITFIIVNNARYEALHHFSKRFGLEHPVGTDLPGLDFVQLAKAQGCDALRVTRAAELEPALRRALVAPGPMLVEVVVA